MALVSIGILGDHFDNLRLCKEFFPDKELIFTEGCVELSKEIANQKIIFQPSYYLIGHLSKFVPAGSKRIAHSSFTNKLESVAFITPQQQVVVVILNSSEKNMPIVLKDIASQGVALLTISKQSIKTLVY